VPLTRKVNELPGLPTELHKTIYLRK